MTITVLDPTVSQLGGELPRRTCADRSPREARPSRHARGADTARGKAITRRSTLPGLAVRGIAASILVLTCPALAACGTAAPVVEPSAGPPLPQRPRPPVAKRVPHTLSAHGISRDDPYYWLRDDDRNDPEVLSYLRDENAYAEAVMAPVANLRESLYREIIARIPPDDASAPYPLDGFLYYDRVEAGKDYRIYCRKRGSTEAAEEVLIDGNARAEGHEFYDLRGLNVSRDGLTLAFAEDTLSRRLYTLRFRNLETGQDLPDAIEGTDGESVWAADNRTVFYVKKEAGTLREYQVWRHLLGTDSTADAMVYEETDEEFSLGINLSRSRDFVLIGSYQTLSHEYRTIDARRPASEPRVFLPREENHEYDIDHANGRFFIRTNWQARDFRLMSVEPANTQDKARWRVEVPAQEGVHLHDFRLFPDYLVVRERRDGIAGLRVIPWRDRDNAYEVAFDEPVYYADFGDNEDFSTSTLRLEYTSLTTPESVFDYDMGSRDRRLVKRERVMGDFDPGRYVTIRTNATARDGTAVPVSIVYRRDLDRSHPQPLLLYGYGSYGYSMDPWFSSARLSLLDRGVIYAIAHIRGGQEMGRAWYEDGKLLSKRNTFNDYIDCAEHLVREGYTAPDRLFAQGGSAGGLLVGAVVNMRPDLFFGAIAQVPFVDVVTTMLDESIPLTTFEYDEWGNPNERVYYDYMMSYSPYDNVTAQGYPHMLVLAGLHDSQVQYWEPAKWVARLRATKTDDKLLLFSVDLDAGHGGASGRFRRHRETAKIYAFLLGLIGEAPSLEGG